MFKKIKKYLLLIPLIMVLCFNVCVYGSVQAVDYSAYFHPWEECPYEFSFSPENPTKISTDCPISSGTRDLYFYAVYMNFSEYDNFLNGLNYKIFVRVYDFRNPDSEYPTVKTENDYFIRFHYLKDISLWTFSYNVSTGSFSKTVSYSVSTANDFLYFKKSGQIRTVPYDAPDSDYFNDGSSVGSHFFMQYTNYPGFDLVNFENESTLDVDVVFSPELTGAFNRTVSDRGQKVTLDDFSFKVSNNSNFDIQYLMAIYRESDTFLPFNTDPLVAKYDSNFNGKTYNGSPVYVYVKDEWLYLPHRQNGVITGYAPSSWHMVSAGDSDFVTINFNQVKLNTYQNYNVVVYAVRNDLAYVTPFTDLHEFQVPACADYNVELDTLQLVYSSQFSILNPAEFDATNNENSYAFDENDRLLFNRANGYIDENGEMVIDRVDTNQWVTEGSDDPWVNFDSDLNAWDTYYKNQNTVSSDIDQLSRNFSSFFKFVNKFFSYFPKNYQSIIILGLTSMVVLGLFKVLI